MKKNVTVSRNDSDRASIEAERGIYRDENGQIIFNSAQKKARIAHFQKKIADFKSRIKNAEAEIKRLEK